MKLLITLFAFLLSAALYGQNDYSMSFDGNSGDNVEINNFAGLSNDITITGWVLFTDSTNQDCIIEKHESTWGGQFPTPTGWWLRKEQRKLRWLGTTVNGSMNNESSINLPIGSYVFVAATYDGVSSKLYINGVDCSGSGQTLSNPGGNIISNSRSIVMGMGRWGAQNNGIYTTMLLDGNISEISIWNTALTQEQIQQYMNCPPSGDEEGLVGYWDFEEGEGDTVYDLSDNGNDGTINGATYSTDVPEQNCVLCIDPIACNYNPDATEDDGSCDYSCCPGPGCCGVGMNWNSEIAECEITNPTDSNLDGCTDLNDLMDILANYGDCEFTCGDDIEHEGYYYSTVQIGDQCWFSENCRYLPVVSASSAGSETSPHYYVYGYEGSTVAEANATDNYETYGVLYNWPAVMTEGICPSGWHIPLDGEWQTMEMALGMSASEASSTGWRGTDEGYQMKSTSGWNYYDGSGNGSNSSGFNGLPGGYCDSGGFYNNGFSASWWSASESGSYSWKRVLWDGLNYTPYDEVFRNDVNRDNGFSARCVRD